MYWYLADIDLIDILICFGIFLILLSLVCLVSRKIIHGIYFSIFSAYLTILVSITLLGRKINNELAFNDWMRSYRMFFEEGKQYIIYDMLLNVLLFVPLGILISVQVQKKVVSSFLVFSTTFIIEILQLLSKRGLFEMADLINNTMGGLIGIVVWHMCASFIKKIQRIRK